MTNNLIAESFYTQQPWAQKPPVNITRRLSAIQGAVSGMQQSLDSYAALTRAQAAAHNERVFLNAEIARNKAEMDRVRAEEMEKERLAAIAAAPRDREYKPKKIDHFAAPRPYDDTGWKLGVALANNVKGWGQWQRRVRVDESRRWNRTLIRGHKRR
jgi:hypothetical protein